MMNNKAEQIIKGIIEPNLKIGSGIHTGHNQTLWTLKYRNQEFDITLNNKTDTQVVIDYFYNQILRLENLK